MLGIGIQENVTVSKAALNERGTLEIEFKQPGSDDIMDALTGNEELTNEETVNIRIYGQEVEYFTKVRDGGTMLGIMHSFRGILTEILEVYIDNPTIDLTKGLKVVKKGMGREEINAIFAIQENIDVVYNSICTQFCDMISPYIDSDDKFRAKFPRRSPEKAFASLPNFGPWVESMDIPKKQSKIAWSKWELKMKKDDATPSVDKKDDADVSAQVEELDSVFAKKD
jgi:hypothetical protein